MKFWALMGTGAKRRELDIDVYLEGDKLVLDTGDERVTADVARLPHRLSAKRWVERLRAEPTPAKSTLGGELEELQFFSLPAGHRGAGGKVD